MATDICTRVGARIREARLKRGWTLQVLADHAEISKVHLIAVEKGRAEVGLRVLERIAEAMEVEVTEFLQSSCAGGKNPPGTMRL